MSQAFDSAHSASAWRAPSLRRLMFSQLARYALVSGVALTLDFTVFLALNTSIGHATISGVSGYAAGTVIHYFLSRRFVFDVARSPKAAHRLFTEFVASGIVGLAVTAAVIALATEMFGVTPIAAKIFAAGASFIGVFLIRCTIVFA
jgi:putative flippase GtrA